ncbi:RES family NAD+ phosphorylase [Allorhizobium sp. NPDC080224]|uniref:RES family NAD+ phosphorylase n=1 Tax=Allorhizobium sp. NPDC080224 TaxID=3390547 RepID=UPI003D08C9AA
MRFKGALYRALNPIYAREPRSGRGAQLNGGRFNNRGVPALYTSLSILTAIREANQVGSLQPTTIVSYKAEVDRVFDSRDEAALAAYGMDAAALADITWRDQIKSSGEARTRAFARQLVKDDYHGLLERGFVHGSSPSDLNLVLWQWADEASSRLIVIDDENRLA